MACIAYTTLLATKTWVHSGLTEEEEEEEAVAKKGGIRTDVCGVLHCIDWGRLC